MTKSKKNQGGEDTDNDTLYKKGSSEMNQGTSYASPPHGPRILRAS